ncbi:MAG: PAS domain-containing protein, partial [Proteobacteria bacterium]|nr:PAS domain-containing protein [Pseudomonadota bacterium]
MMAQKNHSDKSPNPHEQAEEGQRKALDDALQAPHALQESDSYLKKAQEIGKMGHFSYDPVSNVVEDSSELFRIFDVDLSQPLFEAFATAVHPKDAHLIFPFIDRAVQEGTPYDVEHRVRHKNGSVLYVHAKGEIIDTPQGKRMIGTVQDITERKQAEEALLGTQRLLIEAQRMAKLGSWEYDLVTKNITWSKESIFSVMWVSLMNKTQVEQSRFYQRAMVTSQSDNKPVKNPRR